ncbi:hypothetical protein YC2023_104673 [Brassica napus]
MLSIYLISGEMVRWKRSFCRDVVLARLEYLRDIFQIEEGDFLTFDASTRGMLIYGPSTLLLIIKALAVAKCDSL